MKTDSVYIGIIIVLVAVVAYVLFQSGQIDVEQANKDTVAASVRSLYELQYESPSEVLSVTETNGMYKVTVRFTDYASKQATQDVFVTKDGKLLTDRLLIVDNYRASLDFQKRFVDCLNGNGVRVLGKVNDTATLQQLNILGTYSYKLFVSCDGANEQICANVGVRRYPTSVYNNTGYDNIYGADFFSNLTGCPLQ